MEIVRIKTKRTDAAAKLPEYAHSEDKGGNSGADLFSIHDYKVYPGRAVLVNTGLHVEIPVGYEIQIRSKSGLALNSYLFVLNSPGTIDANYRGEIKVILFNVGENAYYIKKGDKVAQAVVAPVAYGEFVEDIELSDTQRGETGFGKSGR